MSDATTRLIAAASAFVGLADPNGDILPGTFARRIREQTGHLSPGDWDVALIHHWGHWSHLDHATGISSWPLIPTDCAQRLAEFAEQRDAIRQEPKAGDIYLQFSPRGRRFVRGGVVAAVLVDAGARWEILSIEGNAGPSGERGGSAVRRVVRRGRPADGDRFVRWTALIRRGRDNAAM